MRIRWPLMLRSTHDAEIAQLREVLDGYKDLVQEDRNELRAMSDSLAAYNEISQKIRAKQELMVADAEATLARVRYEEAERNTAIVLAHAKWSAARGLEC